MARRRLASALLVSFLTTTACASVSSRASTDTERRTVVANVVAPEIAASTDTGAQPANAPSALPVSTGEPAPKAVEEAAQPELVDRCTEARSIVVHKAARTLELRCGGKLAARYRTSLGFAPEGAKEHEGDGKTPEGEYFISVKYPSKYHRSLQIAYPNVADADAGLARGTISKAEHDTIVRDYATCREPPQSTQLGSLVQIHGGGGGPDVGDWTLGCVAVDNEEIEKVFAFQQPGCDAEGHPKTPVTILP